jgi:hypothetical protein
MYTYFRGTTFQFAGALQDNGVPQDLTGASIAISVFDKPGVNLLGTLSVVVQDAVNGLVTVSYGDTSAWPVGIARIDALITFATGQTIASEPDYFRVAQTPMV